MDATEAKVITRVLCDDGSIIPGILYLVGQAIDNEVSVLDKSVSLWKAGIVLSVAVADGRIDQGYPGYARWLKFLQARRISQDYILSIPVSYDQDFNTLTEAQAVVKYMKKISQPRLTISAAPFHQLRAFMTFVSVAKLTYPALKIYNAVGETMDWNKEVTHSQGIQRATRKQLIVEEWNKILMYQKKGDICSFKEVKNYFEWRDSSMV